ncbi:molybdenum cofactor biosynthesis protein MoaC [Bacillus sp. JCM 19046]|nr:molybdenum cofactor biosynthesis protein MoaC [Bacillus sp. JCM 19046]
MAAKNTSSILPYSYPKELTCVLITFDWKISASVWELLIQVEVKAKHATPVDTEAMTSALLQHYPFMTHVINYLNQLY